MNLNQLFTDDGAVSSVIGVILMVAVAVILAATVATFVFDLGGANESAPSAQLTVDADGSNSVLLSHNGGDPITLDDIRVEAAGLTGNPSGELTVGDEVSVSMGGTVNEGDTVTIIHEPADAILFEDAAGTVSGTTSTNPGPSTQLSINDTRLELVDDTGQEDQYNLIVNLTHDGGDTIDAGDLKINASDTAGPIERKATDEFSSAFQSGETRTAELSPATAWTPGGQVEIMVIHEPTGAVLLEETANPS